MWEWGVLYAHLATVGHPPYVAFKLVEINTQYSVVVWLIMARLSSSPLCWLLAAAYEKLLVIKSAVKSFRQRLCDHPLFFRPSYWISIK